MDNTSTSTSTRTSSNKSTLCPRSRKYSQKCFAKNLNDPETPVESTEATVMSLDKMCRSIARENATDSKQASFLNETKRAPEHRGRTKWRRTGKGCGKGSGGGEGYENSRSYEKGKGKSKGNGAGWGGWKPKNHCDNCQGHFVSCESFNHFRLRLVSSSSSSSKWPWQLSQCFLGFHPPHPAPLPLPLHLPFP